MENVEQESWDEIEKEESQDNWEPSYISENQTKKEKNYGI